jgi:hypothetical protein
MREEGNRKNIWERTCKRGEEKTYEGEREEYVKSVTCKGKGKFNKSYDIAKFDHVDTYN